MMENDEVLLHHITMLVTDQQEDAIRNLFKGNEWKCWMKVLSDEQVSCTRNNDLFPDLSGPARQDEVETSPISDVNSEKNEENFIEKDRTDAQNSVPDYNEDTDTDIAESVDEIINNVEHKEKSVKKLRKSVRRKTPISDKKDDKTEIRMPKKKPKVKCSFCDSYFANSTILKRHCLRRHKDVWLEFECKDCPEKFKTKEELWQHRREVKHECPDKIPRKYDKANHTPEELKAMGLLKCQACENFYPNKRMLRCHMYTCHRDLMPKYNCPVCAVEFKTRGELWKHKRQTQHNTSLWTLGNYMCDTCGKIFGRYDGLRVHKNTFCGLREEEIKKLPKVKCDICGATFKSEQRVKAHKRQVHVEAPEVCHICGLLCKNKRGLTLHQKRHDASNRKFVCDDCGKAFFCKTLLKQHIRVHTKEKPYKCPLCYHRCAIKQNVIKHAATVHKTLVVPIDLTKDTQHSFEDIPNVPDVNTSDSNLKMDQYQDTSISDVVQTDVQTSTQVIIPSPVTAAALNISSTETSQSKDVNNYDHILDSGHGKLVTKVSNNPTYYNLDSSIAITNTVTYSHDLIDRGGQEISINGPVTITDTNGHEPESYTPVINRLNIEPQHTYLPNDVTGRGDYQTHIGSQNGSVEMVPKTEPIDYSGMDKYQMTQQVYPQQQEHQSLESLQYQYNWVQSNHS